MRSPQDPDRAPDHADLARRAKARADRIPVGLLFFTTEADVVTVQAQISPLGGQLAHAAGGRYVAAFGQEAGDNPARRALRAAEEVLRQGLARRVRLDLAPVAVQTRKDGSRRFMSPLVTRADRFPPEGGPAGLSLTPDAAAVLPDTSALDDTDPDLHAPAGARRPGDPATAGPGAGPPSGRHPRRGARRSPAPRPIPRPRWRAGR